jgi:tyrosyl-tRNA synthetase
VNAGLHLALLHGESEYDKAVNASQILFGQSTSDALKQIDEATFLSVFEGVPQFEIKSADLPENIIELLAVKTAIFPSKGECRKMIQASGLSINKDKWENVDSTVSAENLLNGRYILVQKGKKNYFIIKIV